MRAPDDPIYAASPKVRAVCQALLAAAVFVLVALWCWVAYAGHTYIIMGDAKDGWLEADGYGQSPSAFAWARATGTAQSPFGAIDTTTATNALVRWYDARALRRGYLYFDCSTVPSEAVAISGTVYLHGTTYDATDDLVMVEGAQSDTLTVTDFGEFVGGVTIGASVELSRVASGSWDKTAYNALGVSASTLQGQIGGWAKYTVVLGADKDNVLPDPLPGRSVWVEMQETAGTADDPYMAVTIQNSDLFDDASIRGDWTTADFYLAGGVVTESGGYLVMSPGGGGTSAPFAVQDDGLNSKTFDLRAALHLDALMPAGHQHALIGAQDYTDVGANGANNAVWVLLDTVVSGTIGVIRYDVVGGAARLGTKVNLGDTRDIYFRIVGNGGAFTCYYKLTPCDAWTELVAHASPLTGASAPLDPVLLSLDAVPDGVGCKWDWFVENSEYPDYPECPATGRRVRIIN